MSKKRALSHPTVESKESSVELDYPSPFHPDGTKGQPALSKKPKRPVRSSQPTAESQETATASMPLVPDQPEDTTPQPVCTPMDPCDIEETAETGFIDREPECTGFPSPHTGGVSDSTVRGRLTSKASAAGMKNAGDLIGLLWSSHATVLRATGGNPSAGKSVLMALAKKDGILTDSQEDPLQTQDPWAGMRGKPSSSSSSGKQSSQLSINKFKNLQLHSALQLQDGSQLPRSELSALDTSSSGFLFVHSTSLSEAMHAVRGPRTSG
eukprot:1809863-Amphidinium_carterae.3